MDWLSQIGQWFVSAWNWIADSVYKSIVADNRYVFYLTGLGNTLLISLMAVVIGITLGVLIAVVVNAAKANPRLNWAKKICSLYVTVIRGTPVVLQLMIIYYIIFRSVQIPQIVVGGLAFGLNSAAYISEIIRSGRFCEKCKYEMSMDLQSVLPKKPVGTQNTRISRDGERMRYL